MGDAVSAPLHAATFNAENFSLLLDRELDRSELEALSDREYHDMNLSIWNPNKERPKIAAIARTILEHDFDLVTLCEIGGLETLDNFNGLYLANRYDCFLYEENSRRGIYVGALLKKGRFPGARAVNVEGEFSRNLLRLDLGSEGGNLQVFAVHLKSQRGEDRGIEFRVEEVKRLASMIPRRKALVMGDFNGILIRGMHQFEFEPLLELPLSDVLAAAGIPQAERHTHWYFGNGGRGSQLDYIFCTHDIEVLEASVISYGEPSNRAERDRLPSDHRFVRAVLQAD